MKLKLIIGFLFLSLLSQGQMLQSLHRVRSTGTSYEPEATALFARVSDWGSCDQTTRKGLMNDLIKAGKTHGWWSKGDCILNFANCSSQMALLYWNKSATASVANSPTFTADRGYQFDGLTQYLNTNFTPSTNGVNYTLNSSTFGFGCLTSSTADNAMSNGTSLGSFAFIFPAFYGIVAGINAGDYGDDAISTQARGYSVVMRNSSTEITIARNKSISTPFASNSTSLPTGSLWMGGRNDGGINQANPFQYNFVFIGGGLSSGEENYLIDDVETYMDAVGAGIIP